MPNRDALLAETSIIVCTVNRVAELEKCLASLQPFVPTAAGVVVVNNGPLGAAIEGIATKYGARVVNEPCCGVSHARNAGIAAAKGSTIAFLDDDSIAGENWLPLLIDPLLDPQVLAVAGSIGSQSLNDEVSRHFDHLHQHQFPSARTTFSWQSSDETFPMRLALVGNANMAIRREAFERFGLFDPRFGRGSRIGSGEEPDMLLRILMGGGTVAVEPAAVILHRHSTEWKAVKRWAFTSGCAHTAMLTKYFLQQPQLRGRIARYVASRVKPRSGAGTSESSQMGPPKLPFLLGSLYGPLAYLLSAGAERL